MKILAIDTSSPQISVAIADGQQILSRTSEIGSASVRLQPCIEQALEKAGLKLKDVDAFAIGEGPGSYNGLRCGFATLRGILMVHPKPVVQLNSMAAMVGVRGTGYGVRGAILNARKNSFFFTKFGMENDTPNLLEEGMVSRVEEIPELRSEKILWASYDVEGFSVSYPDAGVIAGYAAALIENSTRELKLGEPRYLRPPV